MWALFKVNVLLKVASGEFGKDMDSFAEFYADEYDKCIKRGGDMLYGVSVINGNTIAFADALKKALKKGQESGGDNFNILEELYPCFDAYWLGAEMSPIPNPLLKPLLWQSTPPAPGTIQNIGPNPIPLAISAAIHKAEVEALKILEDKIKSQTIDIPPIGIINVYDTVQKIIKKEIVDPDIKNHPVIKGAREIVIKLKEAKKKKPSIGAQIKKAFKFPFPKLPSRKKIIEEAKNKLTEEATKQIEQQLIIPIEDVIIFPIESQINAAIELVKNSIPKPIPTKAQIKKYIKDTINGLKPDIDLSLYITIPTLPTKPELEKMIKDMMPTKPELEAMAYDLIKGLIPDIPYIYLTLPSIIWSTKTNVMIDPFVTMAQLHLLNTGGNMSVMSQYPPPAPPASAILQWNSYNIQNGPIVPDLPSTVELPAIPAIPPIPQLPTLPELPILPTLGIPVPTIPTFGNIKLPLVG